MWPSLVWCALVRDTWVAVAVEGRGAVLYERTPYKVVLVAKTRKPAA